MTLDYRSPRALRPRWNFPWRTVVVLFCVVFGIFMLFCSGLSLPILGGASHDLNNKLRDDFALALPASAVVEKGARIAYVDPSYCFILRVPAADLQPFMDSIRAERKAITNVRDTSAFTRSAPPPPAWFDPNSVADLVSFDVLFSPECVWHWGYSPSTRRIYVRRDSF